MYDTRLSLQATHLPRSIRESIIRLLSGPGLDAAKCLLILDQLLHYAKVWRRPLDEGGDVAVIQIPNLLKLHRRDQWPCCYQTANTFLRILCALGILQKQRGVGGATEYLLSLEPDCVFQPSTDALVALDSLSNPSRTLNKRVRDKASDVKRRLLLSFSFSTLDKPVPTDAKLGVLPLQTKKMRSALQRVDSLLRASYVDESTKLKLLVEIGTVLVELLQGSASLPSVDSLSSIVQATARQVRDQVDSGWQPGAKRSETVHHRCESTTAVDSTSKQCSIPQTGAEPHEAHSAPQNLHASLLEVDSHTCIDNETITLDSLSSPLPLPTKTDRKEKKRDLDIDSRDAGANTQKQLSGCKRFTPREARLLAQFVEETDRNFPAYIGLSLVCSRQVIRAAVVNMLAHSSFPDSDGTLDGFVDGEITGKWGRPQRPGAWVTSLAKAYQQHGIPPVMQLLVRCLEEGDEPFTYQRVKHYFLELQQQQHVTPQQFWDALQQLLCEQEASSPRDQESCTQETAVSSAGQREEAALGCTGMTAEEARSLVDQINQDGRPYGITAGMRSIGMGGWVIDMRVSLAAGEQPNVGADRVITMEVHSTSEWLTYFLPMRELEGTRST
jgi:hypothetical protein